MADKKISQLTAKGAALAATDLIEIAEDNGAGGYVTKSVTGAGVGGGPDTAAPFTAMFIPICIIYQRARIF